LHKGLYSGHNDHNYFEIAHTVKRLSGICGNTRLYTFVDNHDVERIYTKLNNKAHMKNVTLLDYTLPGIPSIYYGSEFGIEGRKGGGDDWVLRPCLELSDFDENAPLPSLIARLGELKKEFRELTDGEYKELTLTTRQFAYSRTLGGSTVITVLNNDDAPAHIEIPLPIDANSAVSLLDCETSHPEVIAEPAEEENEVVQENNIRYTMNVTESAAAAFDAAELADLMKKINRNIEENKDASEMLARAKTKLERLIDDMKNISEVVDSLTPHTVMAAPVPVTVSGGTAFRIEGRTLIVDLAANDGEVIWCK